MKVGCFMNKKRVTMQDIADTCGLSRNTVSKVFNQRGSVKDSTRELVLETAQALGYYVPNLSAASFSEPSGSSIALLTGNMPVNYHFAAYLFTSFTDQVSRAGYTLKIFEITAEEMQEKRLPLHFITQETAGIICIELFDADYLEMLCGLGIPTVSIDSTTDALSEIMHCDFVAMENIAGSTSLVRHLTDQGIKEIGFVGDIKHCGSFYERWLGYIGGLDDAGLSLNKDCCILEKDNLPYGDPDWLLQELNKLSVFPEAFICANDYIALNLMTALKKKGLAIPDDVLIAGFDGIPQTAITDPPLTTVNIPGEYISNLTADMLIKRIKNPQLPFIWTRVKTTPEFRKSTEKQ